MKKNRFTSRLFSNKNILLLSSVSFIILYGCSQYQYMSVNSHLYQDDKKEFVIENDTVSIKYAFAGENFPITITLYNKLLQPVYFDVERSAVVINNYQVEGAFYVDGQINFISPLSYATIISNPLRDQFIKLNPNDSLKNETIVPGMGKNHSFNEETTPEHFRIILALTTNDDLSYPTFFDYSFWISDIIQTYSYPKLISDKPSNQFYIKKQTAFGKTLGWTGAIALVVIGLAVGPVE